MNHAPIPTEYKYKAFISYRHIPRDMAAAKALHTQIERYTIPTGRKDAASRSRKKWKVFRDEEELRVTNDLPQSIHDALDASEYLIVICSPESMDSLWVPREIAYFLRNHDQEHILTVVTAEDPGQMLPDLLVRVSAEGYDTSRMNEPLYMDIRADSNRSMKQLLNERFLKLAATLHGCAYDDLVMREQRRKRTQFLQRLAIMVCFFASIIAVLLWSNHQITGKNEELEQKNEQLYQQQQDIFLRESENLTVQSLDALSEGDLFSAIKNAVSALPAFEGERPYYIPAEQALISSLGLLNNQSDHFFFSETTIESNVPITDFCMTEDGSAVVYLNQYGDVYFYDLQNEEVLWKQSFPKYEDYWHGTILYCSGRNSVIVSFPIAGIISSISCDTGNLNWVYNEEHILNSRVLISPDQSQIIFYTRNVKDGDSPEPYEEAAHLRVISAGSGELMRDIDLSSQLLMDAQQLDLIYTGNDIAECISADNTTFIGYYMAGDTLEYFAVDLIIGTAEVILSLPYNLGEYCYSSIIFTEKSTQFIVMQFGWIDSPVRIIKYDLSTHEILWETDFPKIQSVNYYLSSEELYYTISGEELFFVRENAVMVYDLRSGEQVRMGALDIYVAHLLDNNVEHLFRIDTDIYGVILNDGSLLTINIANDDPGEGMMSVEEVCSLGLDIDNLLYSNHMIYTNVDVIYGGAVETAFDREDRLVIAAINCDDIHKIKVYRRMPIANELATKQVQLIGCHDYIWEAATISINDQYTVIGPLGYEGTSAEDEFLYFYEVLDTDSFQSVCHIPVYDLDDPIYFLPDGSGYIYDGAWYDFDGKIVYEAEMLEWYNHEIATVNNAPLFLYMDYRDAQVRIWYDGTEYSVVNIPEYLKDDEWYGSLGNNGYYVCTYHEMFPKEQVYFAVLDVLDNEWYCIPTDHTIDSFTLGYASWSNYCIGNVSPRLAIWNRQGNLCIYNCDNGNLESEFLVDISTASLMHMEFIADDSYLMLQTDSGLLLILDATSGTIVYFEVLCPNSRSDYIWKPFCDRQEQRLFIRTNLSFDSICIDTATWTKMANIPGMIGYDSETNMVYQTSTELLTAGSRITASYFPL